MSEDMPNREPSMTGNNQITVTSKNSETPGSAVGTESEIPHNKSTLDKHPDTTGATLSDDTPNCELSMTGDNQIMVTSNSPETPGNVVVMEIEIPDNKSTRMSPSTKTLLIPIGL